MRYFAANVLISIVLLFFSAPSFALEARQVTVEGSGGSETLVITLSGQAAYKFFTLENPDRLVVDIPTAEVRFKKGLPAGYRSGLIKQIRFGQFDADTTRLVIDTAGKLSVSDQSAGRRDGYQLRFSLRRFGVRIPVDKDTLKSPPAEITPIKNHEVTAKPESAPPPRKSKPVVVIDAGHGGQDPGAIGISGQYEKGVTLGFARMLKEALENTGKYKVVLTRDADYFILLRERVKKARKAQADIFISIHADSASESYARGFSVYTLSETASDKEAELLAAQENKVDILSGLDLSDESKDVADILIDLAQRETKNKSSRLATSLVDHVKPHVTLLNNTHRFAGFAVLKAPDVPSVLVELGFLTNKEDQRLLQSKPYKQKLVKGMVAGIHHYFQTYQGNY